MTSTRWSSTVLITALFLLAPSAFAGAQTLKPGTRVRVTSSQVVVPVIGNFQGMRRDTVVVIEEGAGAQAWTFRSSDVARIEVSAGMKGGNAGPTTRWALIGAGVGAVTGVIASAILEASSSSKYDNFLSGVVGAGVGGAIGAAYGFRKPREHWTRVAIPRQIGILPTRDGLRVGLSTAF